MLQEIKKTLVNISQNKISAKKKKVLKIIEC